MKYKLIKIKNKKDLKSAFQKGLVSLYISIFAEPLYKEKFSRKNVKNLLLKILEKRGDIFVVYDGNEVIAFGAGYGYNGTYWIEELGTHRKYRRKGVATKITSSLIDKIQSSKKYNCIELTTNINNKAAISFYKKYSFKVISKVFVPSFKLDNKVDIDERVVMRKIINKVKSYDTFLHKMFILNPLGNTTALVFDRVKRKDYAKYAKRIMKLLPKIEQVGFVFKSKKNRIRLEMMGMEFCGNAIRCLGRILFRFPIKTINVETSNIDKPIKLQRGKDIDQIKATIPIKKPKILKLNKGKYLVVLPGICHLLVFERSSKTKVKEYIKQVQKQINPPSIGIIFIKKEKKYKKYTINPYVYVNATNTLLKEHSCASGSLGLAYWHSSNYNCTPCSINVKQPYGPELKVKIESNKAQLEGEVNFILEGKVLINKKKNRINIVKNPIM